MTDDTGPPQYASHSWILGHVSFNCIRQCTIDSFISQRPIQRIQASRLSTRLSILPATCFALSLLSSLSSSSRYWHPRHPSLTPQCSKSDSAKVGSRYFVFHQHLSWGLGHHLSGSLRSDLNDERVVTAVWRTTGPLAFRVFDPRHISPTQELS